MVILQVLVIAVAVLFQTANILGFYSGIKEVLEDYSESTTWKIAKVCFMLAVFLIIFAVIAIVAIAILSQMGFFKPNLG